MLKTYRKRVKSSNAAVFAVAPATENPVASLLAEQNALFAAKVRTLPVAEACVSEESRDFIIL